MALFDKFDRTILRNIHVDHHFTTDDDGKGTLTIGTPGRQGEIKVSGNFNNPEAFKKSLDAAIELRAYANSRMYPTNDNTSKTDKEV